MDKEKEQFIFYNGNVACAVWMQDPEVKTYRRCSYCQAVHKLSTGKLPAVCPGCGMAMIKLDKKLAGFMEALEKYKREETERTDQ